MSLSGHYWTIAPVVHHVVRRPSAPPGSARWSTVVANEAFGEVRLSGLLSQPEGGASRDRALLIVIHGLGGTNESHYVIPAARAAHAIGLPCLRINLRGVAGGADDFYHAGLWQDVAAVVASPSLAEYTNIYILGYSMGGHVTLRYAAAEVDPRVRAVAAICAPLDLDSSAAAIDRPARALYRHHVLAGLKGMVAGVLRRRRQALPISFTSLLRITTLREWDRQVVAPRHGFASAEDYYARVSAGPKLGLLQRPTLLVQSEADPMVIPGTVRPALVGSPAQLDVRWIDRGGHVGFPSTLDLGERAPRGLERQVLAWLVRHGSAANAT
ncbi:YheT family hydrolase [Pendulispora albinea]|uniref:Alpha/beta fold hydrolase n=1 Tax=Pendulispora albinea TaxID=2741071 RepID=A0ABZ2LWK2_9BACT